MTEHTDRPVCGVQHPQSGKNGHRIIECGLTLHDGTTHREVIDGEYGPGWTAPNRHTKPDRSTGAEATRRERDVERLRAELDEIDARVRAGAYGHRVQGHCPACGASTLFVGDGGHLTCSRIECPSPCAADEILADQETAHIVVLKPDTFTVRHPLRERIGDKLMRCPVHERIAALDCAPQPPGRYRVTDTCRPLTRWTWTEIRDGAAPLTGDDHG